MMYVQVAVNVTGVSGVFDYHVPPGMEGKIRIGCLVAVPFGKQLVQGIVLQEVSDPAVMETKPVLGILDDEPVVNERQIRFGYSLSDATLSPLAACLHLFLPPGLTKQGDTLFTLTETSKVEKVQDLTGVQARIVSLLEKRGPLKGRQLDAAFPLRSWREEARKLVQRGVLITQPVLPLPSIRPKTAKMVQLSVAPDEVDKINKSLGRGEAGDRRQLVLDYLKREPWPVLLHWVYAATGANTLDLQRLAELGMVMLTETEVWRDPLEEVDWTPVEQPELTHDQQDAWEKIKNYLGEEGDLFDGFPLLLHGVTGSGKTELFLRAIELVVKKGGQAAFLIPEIALTPQTVRRVLARFPGKTGLVHSKLSPGERFDTWRRIRSGLLQVVVGPRSALFSPFRKLDLIILDEFHDGSYFQGDVPPYYNATEAAILFGRTNGTRVILGSATPPIRSYYRAQLEGWPVINLPNRILAHRGTVEKQLKRLGRVLPTIDGSADTAKLPLPPVKMIDMREELKAGNRSIFSRSLQQGLKDVIESDQQAILFLNRRGRATYVFCRDCGYVAKCPRCDLALTLHLELGVPDDRGRLFCHSCNYSRNMPSSCPNCNGRHIRQYGIGTEKVESELQVLYPEARILRWDAETTRQKGAHEIILSHFLNHRADILVGTQMLAKGLDLPLVTLVGVVLADVGLNFPDYRAAERTFQVLTQVSGRAGRSPLGGQVILQTFQPESYPIQAAASHDYYGFYEVELDKRRQVGYPPFSRLVKFEVRSVYNQMAEKAVRNLAERLSFWLSEGDYGTSSFIIGPVPCYFARVNGQYRWQVILKAADPLEILRGRPLPHDSDKVSYRIIIDPPDLL